ncbi:unnamed protein product [Meganyctiphanes norvegica]|uniref:Uncharacterized protein n=1 Tax=Meganyctiphanes norvegica TaxID=48144 RepID=A0AAV2Q5U1_MEGNR
MNNLILLILAKLLHSGGAITCYTCSSDPNSEDLYDPDCGTNGYDGHSEEDYFKYSCHTKVYEDRSVERYWDDTIFGTGQCFWVDDDVSYWICHCDTTRCNNNNCAYCHQPTTQGPTSATTTAEITPTTPGSPSQGLTCYSCMDCSSVDENTNTITDGEFQSCVTAIFGTEESVMRMGDPDLHLDGECIHEDDGIFCYCITDLCNDSDTFLESAHKKS